MHIIEILMLYASSLTEDTKSIEKNYDEYVSKSVNQLSNYFLKLHGVLQKIETKLMAQIKKEMISTVDIIFNNKEILSNSIKTFEEIIPTLENIVNGKNPLKTNTLIPDVISRSNKILQSVPCEAIYGNIPHFQFRINEIPNIEEKFEKCLKIKTTTAISSQMTTYFGYNNDYITNDKSNDNNDNNSHKIVEEDLSNIYTKHTSSIKILQRPKTNFQRSKSNNQISKNTMPISSLSSSKLSTYNEKKQNHENKLEVMSVYVSHIKNPQEFYVQTEMFKSRFSNLQNQFKLEAGIALTVNYIDMNKTYFVRTAKSWDRGRVVDIINTDLCKVFLIDTGITINISKNYMKTLPENLNEVSAGAQKCSIYGIKPKGEHWTDDSNTFASEVIADQLIQMVIVKKETNHFLVDLITLKTTPTSLRDALIHSDNADTVDILKDKILIKNLVDYNRIKKTLIPPIQDFFCASDLLLQVEIPIIALNVISPNEFYVTKVSDEENIEKLQTDLNDYMCTKGKANIVLVPRENMACACNIEGKWFRARVESVDSRVKCEVYLVDFGDFKQVKCKQLQILDKQFLKYHKYSFKCSLVDVEPIKNIEWSINAIDEFKRFCQSKNLFIFANHNTNASDLAYKVALYIARPNMDLNVNAMMVRAKHAISTGFDSKKIEFPKENIKTKPMNIKSEYDNVILNSSIKLKNTDKNSGRRKIRITHIISPGEFYINLESYIDSIQNLQKEIKMTQDRKLKENSHCLMEHDWKVNENCLALVSLLNNESENWYRATIVKINNDIENNQFYSVYLRDSGATINKLNKIKLSPIDDSLDRIIDNALRCNLACCKSTGNLLNWSKSSIDYFEDLIKQHENSLYASIYGDRNKYNSFPIILHAKINEAVNPLSSDTFRWCNLNMELVNEGYAHLIESFNKKIDNKWKNIIDDFNKNEIKTINPTELDLIDDVFNEKFVCLLNCSRRFDLNDVKSEVDTIIDWLPPNLIEKSIFTGIPTFVDNYANIYLHDSTQTENINQIKDFINKKFQTTAITNTEWKIGQPCTARYHMDKLFYRAKIVEKLLDGAYKVLFIDYGNVEECTEKDLIKEICLTNIPMQASLYKLDGIKPNTPDEKWTRNVLDLIHHEIVSKHCTIRIEANSMNRKDVIKKCYISTSEINDLGEFLIINKLAIKQKSGFLTSNAGKSLLRAIHGNIENDSYSETDEEILTRFEDAHKIEKAPEELYHDYFEREELINLQKSAKLSDDDDSFNDLTYHSGRWKHSHVISDETGEQLLSDEEEDDIKIKNELNDNVDILQATVDDDNGQDNLLKNNFGLDSTCNSFNPKDTSTVISRFDGLEYFAPCEIPFGLRGFYCNINFIRSSLNFFITPLLTELDKKFTEMTQSIKNYVKYATLIEEPIEPNQPCLALFSEDNIWYRALIRSRKRSNKLHDIMYVDYLNNDKLAINKLLKIPKIYLKYPLRLMEVQLNGLKPNERWREIDIKRRLTELLNHKQIYCKIINLGKIPEIEFYESSACEKLVLKSMVDESYYFINK